MPDRNIPQEAFVLVTENMSPGEISALLTRLVLWLAQTGNAETVARALGEAVGRLLAEG